MFSQLSSEPYFLATHSSTSICFSVLVCLIPVITGQYSLHTTSDLMSATHVFGNMEPRSSNDSAAFVILVKSDIINMEQRRVIRETWGRESVSRFASRAIFVLGISDDPQVMGSIAREEAAFGDIVMGSFVDDYYNLTLKTVFSLSWARVHYADKWLLYTDDDVLVNLRNLDGFVQRASGRQQDQHKIYCADKTDTPVIRDVGSKWFVDRETYMAAKYPVYCAGMAILIPPAVVSQLLTSCLDPSTEPKLWIDDVYVTGIAAAAANLTIAPSVLFNAYLDKSDCRVEEFESLIAGGQFHGHQMQRMWSDLKSSGLLLSVKSFLKCHVEASTSDQMLVFFVMLDVIVGLILLSLLFPNGLTQTLTRIKSLVRRSTPHPRYHRIQET